ncbi:MAG TPA: T9SS type A sorting domain-containing protein, partial [Bacteroidia bacterium]
STDPMFIVKYDANGNVLCASALVSGGDDQCGVSADRFGNAYIGGDFMANPFVVGSTTLTLTAGENIFVAKWVCSNKTGIEQFANSNEATIYPNPTSNQFIIEATTTNKLTLYLYDVNGRLVLTKSVSGKATIDVSSLNEGVYTVSIISNEGVVNKKLVILR